MAWGRDSFAEVTGECQCGSTDWLRLVRAVEGSRERNVQVWLFQRDDTLDEDEDECEFVLAAGGGAGAKYLVMRGEGAETGAEAARGGAGRGGGARLNMSRIVSGRLGGGASG